jgi:hypothetical protein
MVPESLDQLGKLTQSGKEDKIGGTKPEVDEDLKTLYDPVAQQRLSYMNLCIKDLVTKHSKTLEDKLKDPIKSRAAKKVYAAREIQNNPLNAGGRIKVNLDEDKAHILKSVQKVLSMMLLFF